jgi:GGDEF domain-containing protein
MNKDEQIEYLREQVKLYKYDYLTGLKQRRDFDYDLRHKLLSGCDFWVCYYDVNGLHKVNREQGFDAGDSLIRQVANDIQRQPVPHTTYRTSGDEFYAICCSEPTEQVDNATMVKVSSRGYNKMRYILKDLDKLMIEAKKRLGRRRED